MTNVNDFDDLSRLTAETLTEFLARSDVESLADPALPEVLSRLVTAKVREAGAANGSTPPDGGLADLIGLGSTAPADLGQAIISPGVINYDDTLNSERLIAAADLYYLYMNESIGVFQVVWKLQELFRAGALRISNGPGAFALYRFDKHSILRYRRPDRQAAYRRVFGYTRGDVGPSARPNPEFHGLFSHFISEVAKFWRDKRISEVIRNKATDPTFGSIAIVRRSGLDLRNNVKNASYGYVNVLRIETSQALKEAFDVLNAPDIRAQFGADNAWDMIELVMWQYYQRAVHASAMNKMATSGRDVLKWLAQPYVQMEDRLPFENALSLIAEASEEWLSSQEGMQLSRPTPPARNVYLPGPPPSAPGRSPARGTTAPRRRARPVLNRT
jgi:hypothetical protein